MAHRTQMIVEQIPHLRRYAYALMRDRDRADDLVQDCLARAISRRHLWKPKSTIRTWLFTILHNLYANHVRDKKRTPDITSDGDLIDRHGEPAKQQNGLEVRDVLSALDKLPEDHRTVILLVGLEGLTYAEAATVVGAPIGTVMSRLSRAREMLRQIMESENGTNLKVVK